LPHSAENHYSAQTEHLMIKELRAAGALSLSLVAEADGKIVGHVAFSEVTINDEFQNWYGLGPISVLPELQKTRNWFQAGSGRACPNPRVGRARLHLVRQPQILSTVWVQVVSGSHL